MCLKQSNSSHVRAAIVTRKTLIADIPVQNPYKPLPRSNQQEKKKRKRKMVPLPAREWQPWRRWRRRRSEMPPLHATGKCERERKREVPPASETLPLLWRWQRWFKRRKAKLSWKWERERERESLARNAWSVTLSLLSFPSFSREGSWPQHLTT